MKIPFTPKPVPANMSPASVSASSSQMPICLYGGIHSCKADLHIHSNVSDGMASVADIMEFTQENTDLDLIAIADHDRVDGSLEALNGGKPPGLSFQGGVCH